MEENIYIYHTNDIHSHLEKWPRISKSLRSFRETHEYLNEAVYAFDLGDFVDRVHPLTEATAGRANVELMNSAHYDAVTIGNNEGVLNTKEELNHLYDKADFSVILSNLKNKGAKTQPDWSEDIRIYDTKKGFKVGVIACTIPLNVSYKPLGWEAEDPLLTIEHYVEEYRDRVDVLVVLSHLGLDFDREIAKRFPVDLIIGAHTHHALPEGEWVENTLIAAAGRYGEYVGEIKLSIDESGIKAGEARLLNTLQDLPPEVNERGLISKYRQDGHKLLRKEKITNLDRTFQVSWQGYSDLTDLGLEALLDYANVDIGILNAGLFLRPLLEGTVTSDDIHSILPHSMRVLVCTLKGSDFIDLIHSMENQRKTLRTLPMKGMGFRGEIFGEICYSGVRCDEDGRVYVKNKLVKEDLDYTFATVDHYLFAPFFPIVRREGQNDILFPEFIRDVVGNYLQRKYPYI